MAKKAAVPGVLASFKYEDAAVEAITGLKAKGFRDLTVYTAAPNHHIEAALDHPVSWVRAFTLIGALTGCGAGFGMTIWMSRDWPLLVGGKSIAAIPPYVVLAFELTILYGAMFTVIGIVLMSLVKSLKGRPYRPEFSDDTIGVFVPCPIDQRPSVRQLLQEAGSELVVDHG
jgi:molybdopterin-containing oxidoreductase family membrane subunit